MRGSEKQIRWAEELIETVTNILAKGLEIIESEDVPEFNKETARTDIARKITGIKNAAHPEEKPVYRPEEWLFSI